MPKFAANLSLMFPEVPLLDRFASARSCGFSAVEVLNPYRETIADLQQCLTDSQLNLVLINTPMGDMKAGERGLGAVPGRESEFQDHFLSAVEYATALEVEKIHVMAGVVPPGIEVHACEDVFVENMRWAQSQIDSTGLKVDLMLEPLNDQDVPGYLYAHTDQAVALIERISPAVRLQFDFYHIEIMEGGVAERLRQLFDWVGHVQFSCVPDRHEPQFGEPDVYPLFELLDSLGYTDWVGCEYRPKMDTYSGLSWGEQYGLGLPGSLQK
ncbi:MAG: TIM barrel protein [Pseudomonadales bacterium]|nr:TIM barrel protein [Pseudomonadales bacterium]